MTARDLIHEIELLPQDERTKVEDWLRAQDFAREDALDSGSRDPAGPRTISHKDWDYRALFEVDHTNRVETVTAMGHRRDVYR